jgi:hypothetical protein
MGYKYPMNSSSFRFTISLFLTFSTYIFWKSIPLKYYCIFFLYKVTDLNNEESTLSSKKIFPGTNY